MVEDTYGQHDYYITTHAEKAPFFGLKDESGELLASCRVTRVNWEIVRLPGKMGGILTKAIPYIPFLNKLIKPKHHTFLVPEIVTAKNYNPALIEELFSAVLEEEKLNLMLWWIDQNDAIYGAVKEQIAWGLFHKIIGAQPVDVVERLHPNSTRKTKGPVFVTAYDMV